MVALDVSKTDALGGSVDSLSDGSPLLAGLTDGQQSRLTELLDRYLVSLENGEPVDTQQLLQDNPDIADIFAAYLRKLDALYGIAAGFGDPLPEQISGGSSTIAMKLGDFTIQREIGRGGMGVVYEARQESLARTVAIKLLPLASLLDARQIARFKNEAHAAGSLQHPNIVPVYSVGSQRGVHYYAMQFIHGISMDRWVQNRSAPDPSDPDIRLANDPSCDYADWRSVIRWSIDIAAALQAAHEAGIVHRDVKPSNLMLDHFGKIWITDFGLARFQTESSLTRSGDVIGTMRYMSPEQARGQSALVDGRTDVYSLAATSFELLTLRPVIAGNDAPTILQRIDQQDFAALRDYRKDLPRDLETVISKAMAKNRDGRYETAAEFADDLRRVMMGEPTVARPLSVIDRVSRVAFRYRSAVLTVAVVGMLSLVGFVVATAMVASAKSVSDAHANRATRNEQLARGAVHRLGSQMAELLAGIPAAENVRRTLLNETLGYYQTFASIADNDPDLKQDLAITFGKIGALQSELGQSEQAIAALRTSESMFSEISAIHDRSCLEWTISQNNLAQALAACGQRESAASYFAKAIQTQRQIVASLPSVAAATAEEGIDDDRQHAVRHLATTLNNLGLLLADAAADAEAETHYLEAIEWLQNRLAIEPDDFDSKTQLCTVLTNLSGLLTKQSPTRASVYARQALSHQLLGLESNPRDVKLATGVIVTLNTLGAAQTAADHSMEAIESLRRAVEIGDQLIARWPDHPTYRRDLVISKNHLGLAFCRSGNLDQALKSFEAALAVGRPLAISFSRDAETQSMLGGVLNNLGFLQQQLGRNDLASAAYTEAIAAQTLAVDLAPEVDRYREFLKKHQANQRGVTQRESAS